MRGLAPVLQRRDHERATNAAVASAGGDLNADVLAVADLQKMLQIAPTRIRVGFPGAGMLAEIIRCMPDASEQLHWWWSWGDPICPAEEIDKAVTMIVHVVRPE